MTKEKLPEGLNLEQLLVLDEVLNLEDHEGADVDDLRDEVWKAINELKNNED